MSYYDTFNEIKNQVDQKRTTQSYYDTFNEIKQRVDADEQQKALNILDRATNNPAINTSTNINKATPGVRTQQDTDINPILEREAFARNQTTMGKLMSAASEMEQQDALRRYELEMKNGNYNPAAYGGNTYGGALDAQRLATGLKGVGKGIVAAPQLYIESLKQMIEDSNNSKDFEKAYGEWYEARHGIRPSENAEDYNIANITPSSADAMPGTPILNSGDAIKQAQADMSKYGTVLTAENSEGMRKMQEVKELQSKALEGLDSGSQWVGEQLMSVAQNIPAIALGIIPGVGQALSLAVMGAIAAGDKVYEISEKGGSAGEAFARGTMSGAIEAATEVVSLDNLVGILKGEAKAPIKWVAKLFDNEAVQVAISNIMRQMGYEASEEMVSYIANYVYDRSLADPDAEFTIKELLGSGLGGAFSAVILGGLGIGIRGGINLINNSNSVKSQGETLNTSDNAEANDLASQNNGTVPPQLGNETANIENAPQSVTKAVRAERSEAEIQGRVAEVRRAAASLGENGARMLSSLYNENMARHADPLVTVDVFDQIYHAALNGKQVSAETEAKLATLFDAEQIRTVAEEAGRIDAARAAQAAYFGEDAGLVQNEALRSMHLSSRTIRALDAVSKIRGVKAEIVDELLDANGEAVNAQYKDGVLQISAKAKNPVRAAFTHEIVHQIRESSPQAYKEMATFVQNNIKQFRPLLEYTYGTAYETSDINEVTEEIVADAFATITEHSDLLDRFVQDNRNAGQKLKDAIHDMIAAVQRALNKQNLQINENQRKAFSELIKDASEMEKLLENALKTGSNTTEANAEANTSESVKHSREVKFSDSYDYSKSFAEQIDDYKAGDFPRNDTLIVRDTPEVFKQIGLLSLPMTYTQNHLSEALANTDGDHLGEELIKKLPEALEHPIAIIDSSSSPGRLVAIIEIPGQTRSTIAAVEIDGTGVMHGNTIDGNVILSAHSRDNAISKLLYDAVQSEADGKGGIYYWEKRKALELARGLGVHFPGFSTISKGFIRSIDDPLSKVKRKINSVFDTKQFKRWFDKSKVVNKDGTPRYVYHWTNSDFTEFDTERSGSSEGMTHGDGIYVSTSPSEFSYAGDRVMKMYAKVTKPFEMQLTKKQAQKVYDKYFRPYHEDRYHTYEPHVLEKLQTPSRVFDYLKEAAENGKTKTSIILHDDLGYDGIHDGSEWVVFNSNQLKSATDNIGTFDKANPDIRYSRDVFDDRYLELAKDPEKNKAELESMVAAAAKEAGYNSPKLYHGTNAFGFTQVDVTKSDDNISFFATNDPNTAGTYAYDTRIRNVKDAAGTRVSGDYRYKDLRFDTQQDLDDFLKKYPNYVTDREMDKLGDNYLYESDSDGQIFERAYNDNKKGSKEYQTYEGVRLKDTPISELRDHPERYSLTDLDRAILKISGGSFGLRDFYDYDDAHLMSSEELIKQFISDYVDMIENGDEETGFNTTDDFFKTTFKGRAPIGEEVTGDSGVYELYANTNGMYKLNGKNSVWSDILFRGKNRTTRQIAELIHDEGKYNGIIISNIWDTAGRQYAAPADIYIFFDPQSQVKSADPVTYDDNGNVIPLSERFNPDNSDIRYSRDIGEVLNSQTETLDKLSVEQALKDQINDYAKTVKELNKAQQKADYWKGQTRLTKEPSVRESDVNKLTRNLIKDYSSKVKTADIADRVRDLGNFILRGHDGETEMTWDEVRQRATDIARDVINNASALTDTGYGDYYAEIKNLLRDTQLRISRKDAADIADYKEWRKHVPGYLKLKYAETENSGNIDQVYTDLQRAYPWLFDEEVTGAASQLQRIIDVMEEIAPLYENPYNQSMAEAIETCANDMIYGLIDNVRQTAPTYADRQQTKLEKQKAVNAEKLARQKAKSAEKLNAVIAENRKRTKELLTQIRADRDAKLEELKQHYREVAEAKRNRKTESEERTRLLKVAKRLQKMKTTAANRTLINELVGDLDTVAKSVTGKTLERLNELQAWYADQKENNPNFIADAHTEKALQRLSQRHISDLTIEEVRDLTDALLNIENEIRTQNELIDSKVRHDTYVAGAEAIEDIKNSKGSNGGIREKYLNSQILSPIRMLHRITGYNEADPLYIATQELADGQRKMYDYQRRANQRFTRWLEDKSFTRKITGKNAQEISITGMTTEGQKTVKITPAMRMSLYLHSLNAQNMKHIAEGGIKVPDMELYKKGKISEAYTKGTRIKLTPSQVRRITAGMTAQERAFAKAAYGYYNGQSRNEINETSEKLKGFSIAGVDYYFPIDTDGNFLKADFDSIKRDGTIEGMGFLKERVNAANPIMLYDLNSVLTKSINQHSKYVGLAIPVRNYGKLLGVTTGSFNDDGSRVNFENSVREAIEQQWGKEGLAYIEKMMSDLNNPLNKRSAWDSLLGGLRSRYAQSVLALNPSVALKQTASYFTAASEIGFAPLMKALADTHNIDMSLIEKYTPLLWYRGQGYASQEMGELAQQGKKLPKWLNWIQAMDLATTKKLWKAAEYYVRDTNTSLKAGTDSYYEAVADVYNRIIENTQPNYTTMQRPALLRSDSDLVKTMNMFKTQPFQNFNVLYDAIGDLNAKRTAYTNDGSAENRAAFETAKKRAAWAISSQAVSALMFAAMGALWDIFRRKDKKYRDDEDDITAGSFAKGLGLNVLSNSFGMLPFGGEMLEIMETTADGILKQYGQDPYFDARYYGVDVSIAETLTNLGQGTIDSLLMISQLVQEAMQSDKDINWETYARRVYDTLESFSNVAGLPVANVRKTVIAIVQNAIASKYGKKQKYIGDYYALRLTSDPERYKTDYYDLLYKAHNRDWTQYNELYDIMLESGHFTKETIKSNMESRMKKSQNVTSVKDLNQRWLPPAQQEVYTVEENKLEKSNLYKKATQEQQDDALDLLYQLVNGSNTSEAASARKRIEGGKSVGLDQTEYILYTIALSMADKPNSNGNLKTYTNAEVEEAIKNVSGLTSRERDYLWEAAGKSSKSTPEW